MGSGGGGGEGADVYAKSSLKNVKYTVTHRVKNLI